MKLHSLSLLLIFNFAGLALSIPQGAPVPSSPSLSLNSTSLTRSITSSSSPSVSLSTSPSIGGSILSAAAASSPSPSSSSSASSSVISFNTSRSSSSSSSFSSSSSPATSSPIPLYYYFRSCVRPSQAGATNNNNNSSNEQDLDGLYMRAYHTGAGSADPVFALGPSWSDRGYLDPSDNSNSNSNSNSNGNDDADDDDDGDSRGQRLLWFEGGTAQLGLRLEFAAANYASWMATTIDGQLGGRGGGEGEAARFELDPSRGLVVVPDSFLSIVFKGWLLCKWYHQGMPQLYWLVVDPASIDIPRSCAVIDLIPEIAT